ncbi:MAG: phospho-sugar mutase [Flavobacteriales bacterium]|nr:phospho-sugar mutase [Flavobacteriales bacterium]
MDLHSQALHKAENWLISAVDEKTQSEIKEMIGTNSSLLIENFASDLEFGTGGLRGVMGVGTAMVNRYTIGMASQGLSNYLKQQRPGQPIKMAIAYDSRNQSKYFCDVAAGVFAANGIETFIFSELRPTPLLSFAVRHLKCSGGVVITASHNPKEYNGYKVYWADGAQILPPHDIGIIEEVRKIQSPGEVLFDGPTSLIHVLGIELDEVYLNRLSEIIRRPEEIKKAEDMKIVFTGIHGSGNTLVPKALEKCGFKSVIVVGEQAIPDGNFPTVHSPNPEEKEALNMALELAIATGAEIVLGTDPDADRVGLAIRDASGDLMLLNGNQSGTLLVYHQLEMLRQKGELKPNHFVAKTIVTSELVATIAQSFGVKIYDTLTGFKYIAGVIGEKEGDEKFICGGEESYGYLVGDFVRDKDAVISSVALCEMAAWAKNRGIGVFGMLLEIYEKFGYYQEDLLSLTYKGLDGKKKIDDMMQRLRQNPPSILGNSGVIVKRDYKEQISFNIKTGESTAIDLPASNVIQLVLEDGSVVTARPSGTEPKIKFYFSLRQEMPYKNLFESLKVSMAKRIQQIQNELIQDEG